MKDRVVRREGRAMEIGQYLDVGVVDDALALLNIDEVSIFKRDRLFKKTAILARDGLLMILYGFTSITIANDDRAAVRLNVAHSVRFDRAAAVFSKEGNCHLRPTCYGRIVILEETRSIRLFGSNYVYHWVARLND